MPRSFRLLIGTYSGVPGGGICSGLFSGGKLAEVHPVGEAANPSFLALHPSGRIVYAVSEVPAGEVLAYSIDLQDGSIQLLDRTSSHGAGPCHIAVNQDGTLALAANYAGGSVCVISLGADGRFEGEPGMIQHSATSCHPTRQNKPHPHGVFPSLDGRFAVVSDLGADRLYVYELDPAGASLRPCGSVLSSKPGAGPRHFTFHPSGTLGYVVNELSSSVTSYHWDSAKGALSERYTASTLVPGFSADNIAAAITTDPTGRFLYVSNRGADTIAVLELGNEGELDMIQSVPSGGRTPRHFVLDPGGAYLLAGNQDSNSIVIFERDCVTGRLTPTGEQADVPAPACLLFVPSRG